MTTLLGKLGLKKRHNKLVSGTAFGVAAGFLVAGAVLYPGFKTTEVELNDGGVWVVSKSRNAVGRLNYPSRVLDGAVTPASTSFDVLQNGLDVFVDDGAGSTLNQVSAANLRLGGDKQLPGSSDVSFGTKVISVTDPASGKVWAVSPSTVNGFDEEVSEPVLDASEGVVSVVGDDDRVYSADPETGEVTITEVDAEGAAVSSDSSTWNGLKGSGDLQLAVVGDKPVVLDAARGKLFLPGGRELALADAGEALLQQSGPAADSVALSTKKALLMQPLDGSTAKTVTFDGEGIPAAPVQLGGCVHAAWSGANKYVRECQDDSQDKNVDVPKASASPSYVFRVNRDLVVLNDVNSGNVWLVNQNMQLVNNWEDVIPPQNESDEQDQESADNNTINVLPDRTKPNRPPETKPDSVGVRPGRTTVLSVLDNDSDPDGDVLTASVPNNGPTSGQLQNIYGGTAFQVKVPADAKPGTETFSYTADDGRGLSATGQVTLNVVGPDENHAPVFKRGGNPTTMLVEQGKTVSQNILTDWMDPDGDDLVLLDAKADNEQDQVKVRRDGLLTYQDSGATAGKKNVTVTIWDGRETVTGTVVVNVQPPGALAPVVNADHVTAVAGQDLVISPLKNDVDPNGGALRLAQVEASGPAEIGPITDGGTFTFKSGTTGPIYLTYIASNGPQSSQGLIRVDVKSGEDSGDPVAVHDVALMPVGGSVLLDPLANDSDPAGGVLVLQSVKVPEDSSASISVIDHSVIRITDLGATAEPFLFEYTMSNGSKSATGSVTVVPVPAPAIVEAPQPKPDEVNVRVGDVVTIPVLENDTHPQGQELTVDPVLPQGIDEVDGKVFVSENTIRFIAGPLPKTVRAIYNAVDPQGQKSAAAVTIHILPLEGAENSRPQPKNLTARVVASGTVRIPVPLDGIDPDGDSVQLTGIDSTPAMGTATVGSNFIDFTAAGDGSGTDTFRYKVVDRQGATNTGTVTVGVAPRGDVNQNPTPVDDEVKVRPGRQIAVDASGNDTDPDGDPIRILTDGITADPSLEAAVSQTSGRIILRAPAQEGTVNLQYTIADDRDATAQAAITVVVDSTVPLQAPIARDDRVTSAQTLGKTAVDVPVLKNDEDPDGVGENLKISTEALTARPGSEGNMIVELTEGPQLIPYTVEDVDGQKATAIIWVPGLGQQVPTLAKDDVLELVSGQSITVDLNEWVKVRDGRTPRITQADSIKLIGGDGSDPLASPTSLKYTAGAEYVGPGSISFEVTDGTAVDDPAGLKSTLSIRTKVLPDPNKNNPPTLLGASVTVPKGESRDTDLSRLTEDPDKDDVGNMKYELAGGNTGSFKVSMDGKVLKVSTDATTATGVTGTVQVKATDPRGLEATATYQLAVTASDRPKPVANDDVEDNAAAGKQSSINVLANDTNPFPETALKIVEATVETGQGGTEVAGDSVLVTPASGFSGSMIVAYTVQDKTGEASRQATARIRLNVKDKPMAPGTPQAQSVGDRTALLTWTAPADRGSPITGYTVYGEAGFQQACPANTCTLNGLTNNTKYHFEVTATNALGESDRSPASAEVRPDVKPDTPAAPAGKFGDKQATFTWTAPLSKGSPIKSYDLEISPQPAGQNAQVQNLTSTSYVWQGLQNGVSYKVRVLARNDAKDPSEWSPYSAAVVPAGPPMTPTAPTATSAPSVGAESQMRVSWTAPNNNGDAISAYTLTTFRGGAVVTSQQVAATSANVTVDNSEANYTFTVSATNKAGTSQTSPQSSPVRAAGKPGMVNGGTVRETGNSGQLEVTFTPLTEPQRNGSTPGEIQYTYTTSTGARGPIAPGGGVINGLPNGTNVTVNIIATSTKTGQAGDARNIGAANPYGPPNAPNVNGQKSSPEDKRVYWTWNNPATNGRALDHYEVRVNGGAWQGVGKANSYDVGTGGFNETRTLEVRAFTVVYGPAGRANSTSGNPPPPPPPPVKNMVKVTSQAINSCTEPAGGGSGYDPGPPRRCYGVTSPGGPGAPYPWLSMNDAAVEVSRCGSPWGTSGWYQITGGQYNSRWVRADTVYFSSGRAPC
ncbi:Ig-like domain-containing protein [Pseudarthrobacter sp. J75]|uniref:Ig-like domain-containing protein n=1 Tax=unclassified Pseudarthrobacter TaxID=2647000 RepID=UPI002E81BEA7|nr:MULTISPECIES: Ig-like domain-containing protein [unclassified Pseudarthrobacter]MEE2521699.1 Ig-like domain-containing protein [Pseudarthrobacter sp. J47]MEE2527776.1 Ig-like domain-containing protein [Pseudarthrobacter sp. J75]